MIAPETGRRMRVEELTCNRELCRWPRNSNHSTRAVRVISSATPGAHWTSTAPLSRICSTLCLKNSVRCPKAWRPAFVATDPVIKQALDPLLLEHRARIFRQHFRDPMEM
jgi:hypothetical protein